MTLTGSDWQAGDTVHVAVNDDGSDAWDHSADVTVAADGTHHRHVRSSGRPRRRVHRHGHRSRPTGARRRRSASPPGFGSATEPYLVRFAAGTSTDAQAQILAAAGAVSTNYIAPLRIHGVLLPGGAGLQTSLDKLRSYASVTRVEPDRTREAGGTPNDSNYGDQWSLTKIGWENVYGEVSVSGTARVAILDTGIDGSHPDLDGNVVSGTSILDGSNGLSDPNGHGTAMAGIVAAETNNGAGVAGVGYAGVQVMPVTVLGADGTGQDSEIIEGVVYAAEHDADVILMAFSNPGYSEMLQAAIDYAWDEGAVLVAATGNDGSSSRDVPRRRPRRDRRLEHRSERRAERLEQLRPGRLPRRARNRDRNDGRRRRHHDDQRHVGVRGARRGRGRTDQGRIRRLERRHRVAAGEERGAGRLAGADRQRPPEPRSRDRGHLDGLDSAGRRGSGRRRRPVRRPVCGGSAVDQPRHCADIRPAVDHAKLLPSS